MIETLKYKPGDVLYLPASHQVFAVNPNPNPNPKLPLLSTADENASMSQTFVLCDMLIHYSQRGVCSLIWVSTVHCCAAVITHQHTKCSSSTVKKQTPTNVA